METKYQRLGREQAERQAARAKKMADEQRAKSRAIRRERAIARDGRRERAYLDALIRD